MTIYFGENIKKLRKEKELTQEALADFLDVSFQTISKWERGETYPDITILPVIASFFNVTIDDLFGVDKAKKEEKINEYLDLYERWRIKETAETFAKFKVAVKEFPGVFCILIRYMELLRCECDYRDEKATNELLSIYDNIQRHCTDDSIRMWSKRIICQHLNRLAGCTNNYDYQKQANEILAEMPSLLNSKEYLEVTMNDNVEMQRTVCETAITELLYLLDNCFDHYCYYDSNFTTEYKIEVVSNTNALFHTFYQNENYGKNWMHLVYNYGHLGHWHFEIGKEKEALHYLKIAAEYAVKCDSVFDNTETVAKFYEQERDYREMNMCTRMKELITKHYPLSAEFKSKPEFQEIIKILE